MKYVYSGRNMNVTEDLKSYTEKRMKKLEKYFNEDTEVHVTFSVQKNTQKAEVTIPVKGTVIRAEETSSDMYAAIDLLDEVVERQLRRNRKKLIDRQQNRQSFSSYYMDNQIDEDVEEEEPIRIVRSKKFAVKPMDPEEACLEMEMIGHNFYVFRNSETDQICVVYKRKAGDYGLIEPEA